MRPAAPGRLQLNLSVLQKITVLDDELGRFTLRVLVVGLLCLCAILIICLTVVGFVADLRVQEQPYGKTIPTGSVLNFIFSALFIVFQLGAFIVVHEYAVKTAESTDNGTLNAFEEDVELTYRRYGLLTCILLVCEVARESVFYEGLQQPSYWLCFAEIMLFLYTNMDAAEKIHFWTRYRSEQYSVRQFKYGFALFAVSATAAYLSLTMLTVASGLINNSDLS
jgi:hypothetical protein